MKNIHKTFRSRHCKKLRERAMSGLLLSSSLALKKKKPIMLADSTTPSRSPSPERAMNKNVKVRRREGNGDLVFFPRLVRGALAKT